MRRRTLLIVAKTVILSVGIAIVFNRHASSSDPACYIEMPDGQQTNLEHLCVAEEADTSTNIKLDAETLANLEMIGMSESKYLELLSLQETDPSAAEKQFRDFICEFEVSQGLDRERCGATTIIMNP